MASKRKKKSGILKRGKATKVRLVKRYDSYCLHSKDSKPFDSDGLYNYNYDAFFCASMFHRVTGIRLRENTMVEATLVFKDIKELAK